MEDAATITQSPTFHSGRVDAVLTVDWVDALEDPPEAA